MAIAQVTKFVAGDGKEFASFTEAEAYERTRELKEFCVENAYYPHDDDPCFEKLANALLANYKLVKLENS